MPCGAEFTCGDDAPLTRFHTRSIVTAGMGFFIDAYDLFIIGTPTTLIARQWNPSSSETTFVLPGEVLPTSMRTTGHGISAGFAKVGAFIGVYVFPIIEDDFGVNGALRLSALFAVIGTLLTLLIPEGARRSLDELSSEDVVASAEQIVGIGEPGELGEWEETPAPT